MRIKLLAFGIAKDIIGSANLELQLDGPTDLARVKAHLMEQFPDFAKLRSLTFAVNTAYQQDDFQLKDNDEVVLIPPVSGG